MHDTSSGGSGVIGASSLTLPRLHKKLLHLAPRQHEEAFWAGQYTTLDMFSCISVPIFQMFYIYIFRPNPRVTAVWGCSMAAKGYRLGLMLLPAARQAKAYAQHRYWLVLAECVLQQLVAMWLLTRGPQAADWALHMQTQTQSTAAVALMTLILLGGVTSAYTHAFWHPLDIVSQAALNSVFLGIHFPPAVAQVAYPMALLVRRWPQLVWVQWGMESGCRALAHFCASGLATLALTVSSSSSSNSSSSRAGSPGSLWAAGLPAAPTAMQQQSAQQHSSLLLLDEECGSTGLQSLLSTAAARAVAVPARPAPDVSTTAGRLILCLSMAYMLFAVLFLPLLFVWRLERHLKSKFVAVCTSPPQMHSSSSPARKQQQQKQQQQQSLGGGAPAVAGAATPTRIDSLTSSQQQASASTTDQGPCNAPSVFHTVHVVLPLLPRPVQLLRMVGMAAVACCMAGELFVWLCVQFPGVTGVLTVQMVGV